MKILISILIKMLIGVMVLSVVVVGLSCILTPASIGIDDKEIGGYTIREMGLAHQSLFKIARMALSLYFGTHTLDYYYTPESAIESLSSKVGSSYISRYSDLLNSPLSYGTETEIAFSGDELCYISTLAFDGANSSFSDIEELILDGFDYTNAQFILFEVSEKGKYIYLNVLVEMNLDDSIVSEINSINVVEVGSKVYGEFDCKYILSDGELISQETDSTISINEMSVGATSTAAGLLMSVVTEEEVDGEEFTEEVNNSLSELIATTLNNMGEIIGVEDDYLIILTRS